MSLFCIQGLVLGKYERSQLDMAASLLKWRKDNPEKTPGMGKRVSEEEKKLAQWVKSMRKGLKLRGADAKKWRKVCYRSTLRFIQDNEDIGFILEDTKVSPICAVQQKSISTQYR